MERFLAEADGILVPGGFGSRGIEGKIAAIRYARTKKIPFFGICLGMQCAVIEFSRNVCSLSSNSTEFDKDTRDPVIFLMERWYNHRTGRVEERSRDSQMGAVLGYSVSSVGLSTAGFQTFWAGDGVSCLLI